MNSRYILCVLQESIKAFGENSFDDKGPNEVMNIPSLTLALNDLPVEQVIKTLEEVIDGDERGGPLVQSILFDMQSITDDRWEALMGSEKLREIFE